MKKVLYLSYDGLTDPLGQAQVIPYIVGLAREGFTIHVVSFEKPGAKASATDVRRLLEMEGIAWHSLSYTKRPPVLSTVWDVGRLRTVAFRLHTVESFDLVHCRSYLPALVGLALKLRSGVRFLFDMRGFWPDEKLDAGAWPQRNPVYHAVYRFFKRREQAFLAEADGVVSLTHAAMADLRPILEPRGLPERAQRVIPCSVDFDKFRIPTAEERSVARRALGLPDESLVLTYLGSTGGGYLLGEMLDFFQVVRAERPDSRFLVITPDESSVIRAKAHRVGLDPDSILVCSAVREDVPRLLAAADLGIFFLRATPSKRASSPTKLGELLAMGIPVITGPGIGDVEQQLREVSGGLVLESFSLESYARAAATLDELTATDRAKIRAQSAAIFGLGQALSEYAALYGELVGSHGATEPNLGSA